ncbi:MAG TPA: 16S rRNA (uracil(1498)-N(3))-methyltransferase [Candidatus Tumulicola sp.]
MPARRFFVAGTHEIGSHVEIDGSDVHKIANVLRMRAGDALEIVDSSGTLFAAILAHESAGMRAELVRRETTAPVEIVRIDIAQAVPKGSKMDYVIEKATELGAGAILPFTSERSIAGEGSHKVERWRRLAENAARQCGRLDIPRVAGVVPFEQTIAAFDDYDVALFAWELAPQIPLRERLEQTLRGVRSAIVAIGPEGGFSHAEAEAATARGAELLWLGPRILRTETAALALLAVIGAFADASVATTGRN